ncbi:hypothetical protein NC653_035805 [Populus alba x Populus x berolinensis]|uniref:mannan endo-1,4-beta-mannosidase n=1 Tax=Populus alba x Populus x berolinensis TaxID=444605 RepID=A0AAD6LIA1_9ROSI|nr:hypothetical protein NC653_035805 [Populus alba x Populus x berolinensis]
MATQDGIDSTQFIIINDGDGYRESAFYVNGWNSYWLRMESVWSSSRSKVSEMLKRGSQMGLTVCRTWAFSDGHGPDALQVSPGVFNERVFKGLDYVIVEARRNRIRLILSLVNNLVAFGGKTQYVKWAKEAGVNVSSSDDSFFSNPVIKDYFKAYIKALFDCKMNGSIEYEFLLCIFQAVVKRKNSLSGVRYSEEPAIFAWELMNEPRCSSSSSAPAFRVMVLFDGSILSRIISFSLVLYDGGVVCSYLLLTLPKGYALLLFKQIFWFTFESNVIEIIVVLFLWLKAWIAGMAASIKSLDKRHVVTVGLEGFYGLNTTNKSEVNPGIWAASLGSDFIPNSAISNINVASVHAYPDSWIPHGDLEERTSYLSDWVDSHISDGDIALRKPVLFTEVSSSRTWMRRECLTEMFC